MSSPHGRPKESAVPLEGTAPCAREQISPLGGTARSARVHRMSAATASIEHPDLRPVRRDERRQAFALLWRAARPDRRQLALASALMLVAGGLEALGPIFGKLFIDEYLLPRRLEWLPVALLVAGIVVSGGVASALRYFQLVRLAAVAMRSVRRLRESVYNHVLRLPMAFFDRAITGQLVSRITNDTEQIRQLYVQVLFEMLQGVTVLIGAVVAMAWLDWRLMLIVLTLDSGDGGDRDRLPAPFGACGDALAGIAQRHQRADGRKHRRYERATGDRLRPTLRRAVCEHQSRALQGAVG